MRVGSMDWRGMHFKAPWPNIKIQEEGMPSWLHAFFLLLRGLGGRMGVTSGFSALSETVLRDPALTDGATQESE